MTTRITRADLSQAFGPEWVRRNPKLVRALEGIQDAAYTAESRTVGNAEATQALQDATVITLSPNETLTNERILALGPGLDANDSGAGGALTIFMQFPIFLNGGFGCTFNLAADTNLDLPTEGKVPSSAIGPYADDAAAAAAGVNVGEWYAKTGGTVAWRQV